MVHIILLILKTAGIVFLSLLGIVLLLLAAILFLPVTYRVYAEKEEKIKVHAAGGWMFRMLSVHYRLDENGRDFVVCFLGIPIYRPGKEKRSSRSSKKKRKTSLPHKQLTESKPECGAGEESSRVHASEQNEEPAAAADTLADLKEEKAQTGKEQIGRGDFWADLPMQSTGSVIELRQYGMHAVKFHVQFVLCWIARTSCWNFGIWRSIGGHVRRS